MRAIGLILAVRNSITTTTLATPANRISINMEAMAKVTVMMHSATHTPANVTTTTTNATPTTNGRDKRRTVTAIIILILMRRTISLGRSTRMLIMNDEEDGNSSMRTT